MQNQIIFFSLRALRTLTTLGGLLCCFFVHGTQSQVLDTNKFYDIPELVVTERLARTEVRSTAPLQILSQKKIETLNALQVSDAVKYFSGVTVKDYGGIGGLKTVSIRSLGAAHTAISYDGIAVSDCQNGQIDIGRFSLDNVDMLSLSNGQSDQIFQPARLFASAGVLNIRSKTPVFDDKNINGKVAFKTGSFGLINPSLNMNVRLRPKLWANVGAEWISAHGQYPYVLHYGNAQDSSSVEKRTNTDVQNLRIEGSLFGNFSENQTAYLKLYYYQSDRGLPGATIFYNTDNFSAQRLLDRTFFAQGNYQKTFNNKWSLQGNAKYNYAFVRYTDPTVLNSLGKEESNYVQTEYYVSASALYKALPNFSLSVATDGFINYLSADVTDFSEPTRYTWLTALAAKYVNEYVLATASVLGTMVFESVKTGVSAQNQQKLSPYFSVSVKPWLETDVRFRAFYKNIFRMPTFNDLYYNRVGNTSLKPETTHQFNIGVTYSVSIGEFIPLLSITADGYHNKVQNKIVAYPTKNIYTWTMLNYGSVLVNGADVNAEMSIVPCKKMVLVLGGTYNYMQALNVTDPQSRDYKHQIPYTPRASGSAKMAIETPWVNMAYAMLWSGHRYAINQNYAENRVDGYTDHSLSFYRTFKIKSTPLTLRAECLNIGGKNYEIIRYFPMAATSWRATVQVNL